MMSWFNRGKADEQLQNKLERLMATNVSLESIVINQQEIIVKQQKMIENLNNGIEQYHKILFEREDK